MAVITTLAACSTNPALNGPDGSDLPSTLDDAIRYALSFIAQLRDGAGMPAGAIVPFPTASAPLGYLKLNGALVSRTTYAALFAFATSATLVSEAAWSGGQFGSFSVGDGSTTFRLPDLRAMFLRGLDESRGLDTSRVLGVWQDHTVLTHTHGVTDPTHAHNVYDPGHVHGASTDVQGVHQHSYAAAVNTVFTAGGAAPVAQATGAATSADGAHGHNVTINLNGTNIAIYGNPTGISIQAAGSPEGRPRNLAYPFFIKY
jgi:microcystin-dependent protein